MSCLGFIQHMEIFGTQSQIESLLDGLKLSKADFMTRESGSDSDKRSLELGERFADAIRRHCAGRLVLGHTRLWRTEGGLELMWISLSLMMDTVASYLSGHHPELLIRISEEPEDYTDRGVIEILIWKSGQMIRKIRSEDYRPLGQRSPYFQKLQCLAFGMHLFSAGADFRSLFERIKINVLYEYVFISLYGEELDEVPGYPFDAGDARSTRWSCLVTRGHSVGYLISKRAGLSLPLFVVNPESPSEIFVPQGF